MCPYLAQKGTLPPSDDPDVLLIRSYEESMTREELNSIILRGMKDNAEIAVEKYKKGKKIYEYGLNEEVRVRKILSIGKRKVRWPYRATIQEISKNNTFRLKWITQGPDGEASNTISLKFYAAGDIKPLTKLSNPHLLEKSSLCDRLFSSPAMIRGQTLDGIPRVPVEIDSDSEGEREGVNENLGKECERSEINEAYTLSNENDNQHEVCMAIGAGTGLSQIRIAYQAGEEDNSLADLSIGVFTDDEGDVAENPKITGSETPPKKSQTREDGDETVICIETQSLSFQQTESDSEFWESDRSIQVEKREAQKAKTKEFEKQRKRFSSKRRVEQYYGENERQGEVLHSPKPKIQPAPGNKKKQPSLSRQIQQIETGARLQKRRRISQSVKC